MRIKENIALSESGFLFDPNSGESFSVNASGKEILKFLSSGKQMSEIEAIIMAEYDVEQKTFNRYIDDFMHTLRRFNLLENEIDE